MRGKVMMGDRNPIYRYVAWLLIFTTLFTCVNPTNFAYSAEEKNWEVEYWLETDEGIPLAAESDGIQLTLKSSESVAIGMMLAEGKRKTARRFGESFHIYMPEPLYDLITENGASPIEGFLESDLAKDGYLLEVTDLYAEEATNSNASESNATGSNATGEDGVYKLTFRFAEDLRKADDPKLLEVEATEGKLLFTAPENTQLTLTQEGNDCWITMVDLTGTDGAADILYDPQPISMEEVQEWIDRIMEAIADVSEDNDYLSMLDALAEAKPHWEFEVDANLIPEGWYCAEAEDDDGKPLYWTLFATAVPELLASADPGAAINLKWISSVGTVDEDSLEITPSNNTTQAVKLQLTFQIIGVNADAGDIVIKIPKSIFYTRTGDATGAISLPLPGNTSFNYSIEGDDIVITNFAQVIGGSNFMTEIEYTFMPYLIEDGYINSDIQASATLFPGEQEEVTCDSNKLSVKINTDAKIGSLQKNSSVKYEQWQSIWGTAPNDAADYFYIVWQIFLLPSTTATQPYTVTFEDNPAPGTVVGYGPNVNCSGAATTSSLSYSNTSPDTSVTSWYGYVVVKYPRALLTGNNPTTEFTNTITANLQGEDAGTTDNQVVTSPAYIYQSINFNYSGDLFSFYKSSSNPSNTANYGAINAIEKDESARVGGSGYDFSLNTTSKGWGLTKDDAGIYGKENYTVELVDDLLYLNNTALKSEDYSVSSFYIFSLMEYDYSVDNEKGIVALLNNDYDTYSPIEVWFTTDNTDSSSWQKHGTVTRTSSGYGYTYSDGGGTVTVDASNKINLPDNCGVKFIHQSSRFQVSMEARIDVKLNPTVHVKGLIENKSFATLNNIGTFLIKDKNDKIVNPVGDETISATVKPDIQLKDATKYGRDVQHATHQLTLYRLSAATSISKTAGTISRDEVNKLERLPYTIIVQEYGSYSSASLSSEKAKALGFVANQKEGVFYDLLPAGMTADLGTLKVTTWHSNAGRGSACAYTVELKDNWQESGQTMMIVSVKAPGDQNYFDTGSILRSGFVLEYTLVCTWQNIQDYSALQRNSVAYRAGEGTLTAGGTANSSSLHFKQYFSDLDNDNTADDTEKNTVYAQSTTTLSSLGATQDGLQKMVKAADKVSYGDTAEVPATGIYTYRLRFGNDSDKEAKDLIFYDVLETACDSNNSSWQGTLVSIDTSYAVSKGIAPVVYYSTEPNLDPYTNTTDANLATSVWEKWDDMQDGFDLGEIKAIAIDFSKNKDGTDHILDKVASMLCYVTMRAPSNYQDFIDPDVAYAYNKASYSVTSVTSEGNLTRTAESLATKVSIRKPDIEIQKTADPASGTESDPKYVPAGSTINYNVSLTNTNNGGEAITGIKFTDTILAGLTVDIDEIKFYFGNNSGSAALIGSNTSGVSVSWASGSSKTLEFTVDRLTAAQTVHFIIPAVVGSGTQSLIKNTATITELNGHSDFEIESNPTYHSKSPVLQLTGTKEMSGRNLTTADNFTFTVKEGTKIVATGANNGTGTITFTDIFYTGVGPHTYTVTEDATSIPGVSIDNGSCTVVVEVTADAISGELKVNVVSGTIKFTNIYGITSPVTVNLMGTKTLSGRALKAGEFSFKVTEPDEYENPVTVTTGTNDADGVITFPPIVYRSLSDKGLHTYTISEVDNSLGGITYSAAQFTVTVNVTDNGNGTLTATPTYPDGSIVFSNSYEITAAGSVVVDLTGSKKLVGRDLKDGEFSFKVMEPGEDENPVTVATGTNDADGVITFTPIGYTSLSDTGLHTYTISEVDNSLGGITYSAAQFTVTVKFTDDGYGNLAAATTYPTGGIVFSNSYEVIDTDGYAGVNLMGTKTLSGRALKAGEFSFKVTETDASNQVNTVATGTNDANGVITFTPIGYKALSDTGTHIYTISEINNSLGGVTYSATKFTVTVEVTDDGYGTLMATPVYPTSGIVFSNTYTIVDPSGHANITLEGTKKLTGRTLNEGEFSFIAKDEAGNTVSSTVNNADGSIVFAPVEYTAAGTYIYRVSEVNNNLNRIVYDTTEYTVSVTVVDNGDGTLTATPVYPESGIVFNNRYKSSGGGDSGGDGGTTPTPTQPGTEAPTEPSTEGTGTVPTTPTPETSPTPGGNGTVEIPGNPPSVTIEDPNGNTIYDGPTENGYIDTSGWAPGTYTVYLLDADGVPLGQMLITITDNDMPLTGLSKTGDNSLPYALLMVIMLGAVGSMTALVIKRRKEE